MTNIVDYARNAHDTFDERPFCRVDSLCLSWLSYLRYPSALGVDGRAGLRLADLADEAFAAHMVSSLRDQESSKAILGAMAASPRFANVRACLHVDESSDGLGMQFSATTFVLPDGKGACVAFRGTDDTTVGWKENFRLAGTTAIPAQRRALSYLSETVEELGGGFWVSGHSKGGALAVYVCGMADDETRRQVRACFSHDGPGLCPELRASASWHDDVPLDKTVPRESLVGMLFERSQQGLTVVRSAETGVMQHAPLSWEVRGTDFVCEQGMDYDAWRLSQRLNDWLEDMGEEDRIRFAELLGWLIDTTGETSFSALLRRWSSNRLAMRAALAAAPAEDRELFERAMDDLVTTLLLGSRQEHGITDDDSPKGTANAAARRMEDITAKANDHLSKLDRLVGGK